MRCRHMPEAEFPRASHTRENRRRGIAASLVVNVVMPAGCVQRSVATRVLVRSDPEAAQYAARGRRGVEGVDAMPREGRGCLAEFMSMHSACNLEYATKCPASPSAAATAASACLRGMTRRARCGYRWVPLHGSSAAVMAR